MSNRKMGGGDKTLKLRPNGGASFLSYYVEESYYEDFSYFHRNMAQDCLDGGFWVPVAR